SPARLSRHPAPVTPAALAAPAAPSDPGPAAPVTPAAVATPSSSRAEVLNGSFLVRCKQCQVPVTDLPAVEYEYCSNFGYFPEGGRKVLCHFPVAAFSGYNQEVNIFESSQKHISSAAVRDEGKQRGGCRKQ
ncbi:MAG: hypothetical protein EP313_06915, partial [Bacteroidetes bacterium]